MLHSVRGAARAEDDRSLTDQILIGRRSRNRRCATLGGAEDGVTPNATPADPRLVLDLDPLKGRASVGPGEAPGHFPHAGRAFDILHPKRSWPGFGRVGPSSLAGRMEVLFDNVLERRTLGLRESSPVALECRGDLELQRTSSGSQRVVEVLEESVGTIDDGHAAGGHMFIDFALHRLPTFCPEPALIRRHGQDRAQFDPAVLLLDDLELGSRLVEMKPLTKINRERNGSTRLKR